MAVQVSLKSQIGNRRRAAKFALAAFVAAGVGILVVEAKPQQGQPSSGIQQGGTTQMERERIGAVALYTIDLPAAASRHFGNDLDVFARPQRAEDTIPDEVASRIENLLSKRRAADSGSFMPHTSRLALTMARPWPTSLYVALTTSGWVCYADTANVITRCLGGWEEGLAIGASRNDRVGALHGLLPNDVVSIQVVLEGERYREALVQGNVFVLPITSSREPEERLTALVFRFRDGSRHSVRLKS